MAFAVTLHQPLAQNVAAGIVKIFNMPYAVDHRGILFIHAGKSARLLKGRKDLLKRFVTGAIIGVVDLVGVFDRNAMDYAILESTLTVDGHTRDDILNQEGPYVWCTSRAVMFNFKVPVRGQKYLWYFRPTPNMAIAALNVLCARGKAQEGLPLGIPRHELDIGKRRA